METSTLPSAYLAHRSEDNSHAAALAEPARRTASRLGFWSAALTAALAAAFLIAGVATPPRSGPFCGNLCVPYPYTDVAAFIPGDYLWLIPGLLLAPTFVIMMACIYCYAPDDRKVFGLIGLSFALMYAVVITTNYFIQWTFVAPSILSGETEGLSLFTQYNPHGIFIVLEGIAYLAMSVAFFATAAVFAGGRLERALRWLFVTSFILAVAALLWFVGLRQDSVAFEVSILSINWVVLIVTGALLSVLFRRASRVEASIRVPLYSSG